MKLKGDVFLWSQVALLLILLPLQWMYTQLDISLWLNAQWNHSLYQISSIATYLGDGWLVVGLGLILLFVKPRLGIMVLLCYLLSAGLAQLLKHTLFAEWNRPLWHIQSLGLENVHIEEGMERNFSNSFPSGHSTSAFALFSMLALFTVSKPLKFFLFLLAVFTAFTRIYLLQHFLRDTCAGAIIGSLLSYLIFYFWYEKGKLNFLFQRIEK